MNHAYTEVTTTSNGLPFLNFPSKIRNRIYTHPLVDSDTFCGGRDGMRVLDTYGGILMREVFPGNHDPE